MAPKMGTNAPDDPGNTERFGVIAIMFRVGDGWAQPVATGSAVGSRWWSVASDRRYIMRPACNDLLKPGMTGDNVSLMHVSDAAVGFCVAA